mgnify:CR=1 FL=1
MTKSNKNFEIELNENTVILHKHPDVDRICVWHPFEDRIKVLSFKEFLKASIGCDS